MKGGMNLGQLQERVEDAIKQHGAAAPVRVISTRTAARDATATLANATGSDWGERAFFLVYEDDGEDK